MADSISLRFEKEKETKNAVRFQEVPMDGLVRIGNLYIQKHTLAALGNIDAATVLVDLTLTIDE